MSGFVVNNDEGEPPRGTTGTRLARATLAVVRGTISLVGSTVDAQGMLRFAELKRICTPEEALVMGDTREQRDGKQYHMTILTKHEQAIARETLELDGDGSRSVYEFVQEFMDGCVDFDAHWFSLGLGSLSSRKDTSKAYFDCCIFPRAMQLRKYLGLPQHDFHITVGITGKDCHDGSKSFNRSIITPKGGFVDTCSHDPLSFVKCAQELVRHVTAQNTRDGLNCLGVQVLLDAAEWIIERRSSAGDCLYLLETAKIVLTRIRLLNKIGDLEEIVKVATVAMSTLLDFIPLKSDDGTDSDELVDLQNLVAAIVSFKGAAQVRMGDYSEALPTLEQAFGMEDSLSEEQKVKANACRRRERILLLLRQCRSQLGINQAMPQFRKFPRTKHIYDASESDSSKWGCQTRGSRRTKAATVKSAITRDDLLLSRNDIAKFCDGKTEIYVQEKIDGANLGISIGYDGNFLCQNRSKYVCSADSPQYGSLDLWLDSHAQFLHILLVPGRHILYGEWCVARHSIPYKKLPGYFIAFDLYDRETDLFYSVRRFHETIKNAGRKLGFDLQQSPIPVVPLITKRKFRDPLELLPLLETKSEFRTDGGTVEGVYLRMDDRKWNRSRCKLVRSDFIQNIEDGHWMKRKMEKNQIDVDYSYEYLRGCMKEVEAAFERHGHLVHASNAAPNPRERLQVQVATPEGKGTVEKSITMMRNFSFILPDEVAASSTPKHENHVLALQALGVTLIITLTEEEPLNESWFQHTKSIRNMFVPVPNYNPPSIEQMVLIEKTVRMEILRGGKVMVHCGGGKGRAGTVISCLLLRYGSNGILSQVKKEIEADEAGAGSAAPHFLNSESVMKIVRSRRPGSIETERQERFIRDYSKLLWKRLAKDMEDREKNSALMAGGDLKPLELVRQLSENSSESEEGFQSASDMLNDLKVSCKKSTSRTKAKLKKAEIDAMKARKSARKRCPKYIVLVGFPGSGKSSFAKQMVLNGHGEFVRCNQDDLGRKACFNLIQKHCNGKSRRGRGGGKHVVVDRCNVTVEERKELLETMFSPEPKHTAAVFFNFPALVCSERVAKRTNHPTIKAGTAASKMKIIKSFEKRFVAPQIQEGFGTVHEIKTFEDADRLLYRWGCG
jgi:atypical dual specificity phosphatase